MRHYISTAEPGRIYVAVERAIYAIHLATKKREIVTIVTFEPKCLTAGFGWICVGGTNHGDCALIKIADSQSSANSSLSAPGPSSDVDTPLPLDLDPELRRTSPLAPGESQVDFLPSVRRQPQSDVQLHEFGGSIVNSVALHRLPGDGDYFADEDIAILR